MKKWPFVLVLMLLLSACSSSKKWFATHNDLTIIPTQPIPRGANLNDPCSDNCQYAPDPNHLDYTPVRTLKICFHIMNSDDSTRNFKEAEARVFLRDVLDCMNANLRENEKLRLPFGNNLPVLPVRYQYQLTAATDNPDDDGIYFHYSDSTYYMTIVGKNANNYSSKVTNQLALRRDSVLNYFMMAHPRDSMRSRTYHPTISGISIGGVVKIVGIFENRHPICNYSGPFNHEIGHNLGLMHEWTPDNCKDTPEYTRTCFAPTDAPGCDTAVNNNVMGYNIWQKAWSPCQIGLMQRNFATLGSKQRSKLVPTWCDLNPSARIVIRDDIHWQSAKDIAGHIVIESGGALHISCRVSLPKGARIVVKSGGKLTLENCQLHNSCGEQWEGIVVQTKNGKKGDVIFIGNVQVNDAVHNIK